MLVKGDKQIDEFPDTTDEEFVRDSLAGQPPIPDYEGANLYLPIRLGLNGFEYDDSAIGDYVLKSTEDLEVGELWLNDDKYRVNAYSSDKIPYRRLYEKWSANSEYGLSIYGTGDDEMRYVAKEAVDQSFATSDTDSNINNSAWQSFTPAVTGRLVNINVTMGTPAPAANSTISIYDGEGVTGTLLARETGINLITGANSIVLGKRPQLTSGQKYTIRIENAGNVFWRTNAAGGYAGGSYNGTAADAVFSTTMRVSLVDTYTLASNTGGAVVAAADGAIATSFTFTAVQPDPYIVEITAIDAIGMTAGCYFTYGTTDSRKYIVWYTINGAGTQPFESADVYIRVDLLTSDLAATVNNKTSLAINGYSYKVPLWTGYFIRVFDQQAGIDPDTHLRTTRGDGNNKNSLGSVQQDELKAHIHSIPALRLTGPGGGLLDEGATPVGFNTGSTGGHETRALNRTANMAVKY